MTTAVEQNRSESAAPRARAITRVTDKSGHELVTVTDLAHELGISARTLRFYEDKGLIAPQRIGAARVYSHRERARMILILRGKNLGFSLREIKDYLDLYDADPQHVTQTRSLLKRIAARREQLEQKRLSIEQALAGLDDLEADARTMLAAANTVSSKQG